MAALMWHYAGPAAGLTIPGRHNTFKVRHTYTHNHRVWTHTFAAEMPSSTAPFTYKVHGHLYCIVEPTNYNSLDYTQPLGMMQ